MTTNVPTLKESHTDFAVRPFQGACVRLKESLMSSHKTFRLTAYLAAFGLAAVAP
jgi:hypothetical protein